jgi:branched-chain amino acid transport system permease protein
MALEQLVNGLVLGGIYALIALGYSMIFGVLKFINFAHGDMCMIGGYLALVVLSRFGLPSVATILTATLMAAVVGIVIERVAYRPLRGAGMISTLIGSLGVSVFLQNFSQVAWGADRVPFPSMFRIAFVDLASARIPAVRFYVLGIASVFMLVLQVFVTKTKLGKAMQACFEDLDTASLMGIDTDKVVMIVFGLGAGQAAVAGILLGVTYATIYPTMGSFWGTKAFAAVVLGGIGSMTGAVLGGLLLGIAETFGAAYLSFGYRDAIAFCVLIFTLLLKPRGLLSGKTF